MPRRSGRRERLRLYGRGNTACPICLMGFTRDEAYWGRTVTLEHVPIKALGGRARCLTCGDCNSQAGRHIDQAAAMTAQDRFGVTVDILGKRDTFMLSRDGKSLTPPFAGYSSQDIRDLQNSESRSFTMSLKIPDPRAVAASSLKSGYLAVFSLLGASGGYSYVEKEALAPVRRRIMQPFAHDDIGEYALQAPDDLSPPDIMLAGEPLTCWIVQIAGQLVFLPLSGDNQARRPLQRLRQSYAGQQVEIACRASWPFSTFGAFGTVPVHLAGAGTATSLVGMRIRGTLANGQSLEGTCISHTGESATLLCQSTAIRRANIEPAQPVGST